MSPSSIASPAETAARVSHALAIEISEHSTRAVRLQSIGAARLIQDFSVTASILRREHRTLRVDESSLAGLLKSLGNPAAVTLVIHDALGFNLVLRSAVSSEDQVRESVRQLLRRNHQIELSSVRWTVLALSDRSGARTQDLIASLSSTRILVSGAARGLVDDITRAFERHGAAVETVLFPAACHLKAFELFGGALLEHETVALLHLQPDQCSVSILEAGVLSTHRDFPVTESAPDAALPVLDEVQRFLSGTEGKLKSPVKCVFVSSGGPDPDRIVKCLKAGGRYARGWSAARKLPLASENAARDSLNAIGAELNTAIGAALISCERAADVPGEDAGAFDGYMPARRCGVAACVLAAVLATLLVENANLRSELQRSQTMLQAQQSDTDETRRQLDIINRKIHELQAFTGARTLWSPIIAELRHLEVQGVEVLQMSGSGGMSLVQHGPFTDPANTPSRRRNSGQFVVEARNTAGLKSLEDFMTSLQANTYIAPLLNRRKPVRLVNNIQAAEDARVTRVSVECLLHEKIF